MSTADKFVMFCCVLASLAMLVIDLPGAK